MKKHLLPAIFLSLALGASNIFSIAKPPDQTVQSPASNQSFDETRYSEWMMSMSLGSGYSHYTRAKITDFIPLHCGMEVGYRHFRLVFDGMFGWTSTQEVIAFTSDRIHAQASAQMFHGALAVGYTFWLSDRFSIAPHLGYGMASIDSNDTDSAGRMQGYARDMLTTFLNLSYSFPWMRPPEMQKTKLRYHGVFLRLRVGYSATAFERENLSFNADLFSAIFAVGVNLGTAP